MSNLIHSWKSRPCWRVRLTCHKPVSPGRMLKRSPPRRAELVLAIRAGPRPNQRHLAKHVKVAAIHRCWSWRNAPTCASGAGHAQNRNAARRTRLAFCKRCLTCSASLRIDRNFRHGNSRPPHVSRRWAKKNGRPSSSQMAIIMIG